MPVDDLIAVVAARQHGVVSRRQLRELGLAPAAIAYRTRVGRLHPVHRAVYAVGHQAVSSTGRALAAVLAMGPGSVLSHFTAAELWGLLPPARHAGAATIDVTLARHRQSRRGLRVHSVRALHDEDITTLGGIPITTPARTLVDLAATRANEATLRRAVGEALVQRRTSSQALAAALVRSARRPGVARLAALLGPGPAPTRSALEDRTLAFLHAHGFPRPRVNARLPELGDEVEVDFLYPAERLVIEADGARYHDHRIARERDVTRQARIEAAGYRVVRLTWRQVTRDGPQTVTRLRAAMAQAR